MSSRRRGREGKGSGVSDLFDDLADRLKRAMGRVACWLFGHEWKRGVDLVVSRSNYGAVVDVVRCRRCGERL